MASPTPPPSADARWLEGASLPARLFAIRHPPERLFLHGNLPSGPSVGVVGTRHPTAEAVEFAEKLSSWLASRGVAIISGGAKGIDAAAHRGALAASGATLVVAASSLDCPFPADHAGLYAEVLARGGGYLSRFEYGVPARRHAFLDRNGILVSLCDAVVLVEAPFKSGARNAMAWARELQRPSFVVPSAPWNPRGRGCVLELQLGARALGEPAELLDYLGVPREGDPAPVAAGAPANVPAPLPPGLTGDRELACAVLEALARGARHADEVADALGLGLPRVKYALLLLMLSGDVHQGPGGVLTRARR